jgi:hypothetical protein
MHFLTAFNLPHDFLQLDSATWESNDDYVAACNIARKLKVVNDTAECGVTTMLFSPTRRSRSSILRKLLRIIGYNIQMQRSLPWLMDFVQTVNDL